MSDTLVLCLSERAASLPPPLGDGTFNCPRKGLGGKRFQGRTKNGADPWWVSVLSCFLQHQEPTKKERIKNLTHSPSDLFKAVFHLLEFIPILSHGMHPD